MENQSVKITVETTVLAPIAKVWKTWNTPADVMQWNHASDTWHTPSATCDLREGGSFVYTMAAKDGSFSFDFAGIYETVITNELIQYSMADGRNVQVKFEANGSETKITETFDAETQNSVELQQNGWQAILNNFKAYCEAN